MDEWMDRYSPGCQHSWGVTLSVKAQDNMVLQEHQSSSRWCWRPPLGLMGPHHVTSLLGELFSDSPGWFFFGGQTENQRLKLWSLTIVQQELHPGPKILEYLGRCCPTWGVFLWSDGFCQHQIHRRKTKHFCVSPRLDDQYPENGVADGEIWFQSESFVIFFFCHLSHHLSPTVISPIREFTAAIGKLHGLIWVIRRQRATLPKRSCYWAKPESRCRWWIRSFFWKI